MKNAPEHTRPYPWILHPAIDLLFCCGGLVWVFYAAQYFFFKDVASFQHSPVILALLVLFGHMFADSHTAATLVRVYQNQETRTRFRFCVTWAAVLCAAVLAAGLFVDGLPPYILKLYAIFVIHHYTAQTCGITLLYCYKRNYSLAPLEKRLLWLVMNSTAAFGILREFTFENWGGRQFLYYKLPFIGPLPLIYFEIAKVVLIASVILFVLMILRRIIQKGEVFPLPSFVLMATGVAIFVVEGAISQSMWLFVPAIYHGSQYLVVAGAYHLKEHGLPPGVSTHEIYKALKHSSAVRYAGTVIAGGVCIYIGLPYILTEFGISYAVAFVSVFCAFNFHHFLTDREIWRLRDPGTRKLLLA